MSHGGWGHMLENVSKGHNPSRQRPELNERLATLVKTILYTRWPYILVHRVGSTVYGVYLNSTPVDLIIDGLQCNRDQMEAIAQCFREYRRRLDCPADYLFALISVSGTDVVLRHEGSNAKVRITADFEQARKVTFQIQQAMMGHPKAWALISLVKFMVMYNEQLYAIPITAWVALTITYLEQSGRYITDLEILWREFLEYCCQCLSH